LNKTRQDTGARATLHDVVIVVAAAAANQWQKEEGEL